MTSTRYLPTIVALLAVSLTASQGCGGSGSPDIGANGPSTHATGATDDGGATGPGGGPSFGNPGSDGADGGGPAPPCTGLQCRQHACAGGGSTTISGTVYDPAAKNPLYNVVVYVPNAPVSPLTTGASCDSCASLYTGHPIATAITDAFGRFTLKNAPDGANVPLVVQVGKWRKQIVVPNVTACADNALPDKSVKLPKNKGEGDIPNIAISTGAADSLECLLRRVGLDAGEYGPGAGGQGRIHIFAGSDGGGLGGPNTNPPGPASPQGLWTNAASLMKYDMVLLSCEGNETHGMNPPALFDYAAKGGRVFASHFHYAWFNAGPFAAGNLATWSPGTNSMGNINTTIVTTLANGQPFPKGLALQDWLKNVHALTNGTLPVQDAKHNADVGAANVASQAWIKSDSHAKPAGATQYFTFNTPLGVAPDAQCGRVVFSDLHVGAASGDYGGLSLSRTVPDGCGAGDLSPQEKALEFMLFDLSSCVVPDTQPPAPPPADVPR